MSKCAGWNIQSRSQIPNVAYQIALMQEAGLIDAVVVADDYGLPRQAGIIRLTWAGHDFLDATRDSKIWKMAKEQILKPGVSWTFFSFS